MLCDILCWSSALSASSSAEVMLLCFRSFASNRLLERRISSRVSAGFFLGSPGSRFDLRARLSTVPNKTSTTTKATSTTARRLDEPPGGGRGGATGARRRNLSMGMRAATECERRIQGAVLSSERKATSPVTDTPRFIRHRRGDIKVKSKNRASCVFSFDSKMINSLLSRIPSPVPP